MYHVSKMQIQMYWRLSQLHLPFQPEPRREYLSTVVTCNIANSPLKIIKLQEKTFELKRFLTLTSLEPREWRFSYIDFILYGFYTWQPHRGSCHQKESSSIHYNAITWKLYHWLYDGILVWCLSHKEAQEALIKLMIVCVEHTNLDLSSETDFEDLATIGRKWSLTLSPMLRDVMPKITPYPPVSIINMSALNSLP